MKSDRSRRRALSSSSLPGLSLFVAMKMNGPDTAASFGAFTVDEYGAEPVCHGPYCAEETVPALGVQIGCCQLAGAPDTAVAAVRHWLRAPFGARQIVWCHTETTRRRGTCRRLQSKARPGAASSDRLPIAASRSRATR